MPLLSPMGAERVILGGIWPQTSIWGGFLLELTADLRWMERVL